LYELRVIDLIMMLVVRSKDSRDHSANLELLRTLFEREVGVYNLYFNLIIAGGVATFTAIYGWVSDARLNPPDDFISWIPLILGVVLIIGVIVWLLRIRKRRERIKRHYLELIRLYFLLDKVI